MDDYSDILKFGGVIDDDDELAKFGGSIVQDDVKPQPQAQPQDDGFFSNLSTDNIMPNLREIGTNAVAAAGSYGNNIMRAAESLPLNQAIGYGLDKMSGGAYSQNIQNRQQAIGDLNAQQKDTRSYMPVKLTNDIAATAGVGGALAVGAKAMNLFRTAQILKSGGFNLGAAKTSSVIANTGMRAAGGGAVGGASTLAVSPEELGTGTAWGAALPAGGAAIAKMAGALGKSIVGINDKELAKLAIEKYGIPLSYANITDSNFMKSFRSVLNDAPLSGMVGQNQEAVQAGFNRSISKLIGTNTDSITEDVINANKERLSSNYSKVYGNNDLKLSPDVIGESIELPKSGFLDNSNIPDNAYFKEYGGEKVSGGKGKTLLGAINELGGVKLGLINDVLGNKTAKMAGAQVALFKRNGLGIDDLAGQLADEGYIPPEQMDFDGGVSWLKDSIKSSSAENKIYAMDDLPFYAPKDAELVTQKLSQDEIPNYFKDIRGDKVLSKTPFNVSLRDMRKAAKDLADPRQEANFNRVVDTLLAKSDKGVVTGKQFNNWQANLRTEIESKKGYEKNLLNNLRQAALKHFNDGVSKADKDLLATTNKQYKASKTIEDLVTKGEANVAGRKEGDIPAALLSQAVAKNYKGGVKDSPFGELVKIGNKYIADRVIKTGGSQRAAIQSTVGTAGVLGGYINPLVTALVASGGITINKLLGSPKLARLMVKKDLNKLENAELQKQVKNKELYKQLSNAAVVTSAQ